MPPPFSVASTTMQILASSPMTNSQWKEKVIESSNGRVVVAGIMNSDNNDNSDDGSSSSNNVGGCGRGRARKRLRLYNALASYHTTFLELISEEYRLEESQVITRIESSSSDPFMLERSGHALFDIHPQRRGNLFADEVYRLEKSRDATTTFFNSAAAASATTTTTTTTRIGGGRNGRGKSSGSRSSSSSSGPSPLPPNHNFARNDVIVVTLQPRGTGDFLGTTSLPTNTDAVMVEARVLNVGPAYIDVAIPAGKFSTAFGPASNNVGEEGKGDPDMRVRVDRFFSDVPFRRMVAALGQLTSVPDRQQQQQDGGNPTYDTRVGGFQMDALLKEAVLSTFAIKDDTALDGGMSNPTLGELPKKLAKPPLPTSNQLAACGIYPEEEEDDDKKSSTTTRRAAVDNRPKTQFGMIREFAPDNLPPLSTPFVIIDEACQSVEPASLIPILSTNSCRSLVMLGDPCQLPPTIRSDVSSTGESPLSISLMARLASTLPQPVTITAQKDNTPLETRYLQNKATRNAVSNVSTAPNNNISYRKQYSGSLLLSVQYRMHPSIAAFSSAIFYNGLLSTPIKLGSCRKFPPHLSDMYPSSNTDISVRFVQVGGRNNESREAVKSGSDLPILSTTTISATVTSADPSTSYRNDAEAKRVVQILTSILLRKDETSFQGSIGIVTPYSGQVALIKSMMAKDAELRVLLTSFPHEIEVKSVDAYQGRERDLIIFSTVRSNRQGNIGFLTDWRRMNVALTRAKSGLLVVGDTDTLKDGDKHWHAFVQWCEQMDCLVK